MLAHAQFRSAPVSPFNLVASLIGSGFSTPLRLGLALLVSTTLLADIATIRGLIRSGRVAEAVAAADTELRAAPRNFALHTMKGLALHAAGDKNAALASFRKALSINPDYEPALQAAAQIEFENRDPNAVRTLESLLRLTPASETAHAMLAAILSDRQSCNAAIPHFEKANKAAQTPSLRWQYGVCLMAAQKWPEAAAQFEWLLAIREHAPTRYNLALAQWNAGKYPQALATLTPLEGQGSDPEAMRLIASTHEAMGHTPEAIAVLQRALRENPANEPLLIDLAIVCMDHKALQLSLDVVRAGIQAKPRSVKLNTLLGVVLVRSGEVAKAQEAFEKAQSLSPESGLGRIGLASTLMQLGLAADAAQVLRGQLAANGPNAKAELTLARALLLKSPSEAEQREAVALLHRVLRQEPENAAAHGLLGKVYTQLGDTPNAIANLSAALRLDPADRTSAYQLMMIYRKSGKVKEAAELASRVRALLDKENAEQDAASRFRVVREDANPAVP